MIKIHSQQDGIAARSFVEKTVKAEDLCPFVLVRDVANWIALPALVNALFALRVVRESQRPVIKKA